MTARVLTARCLETSPPADGEGQWLVELPATPVRHLLVVVMPVGDDKKEKWIARGYDKPTERHFGGAGATALDALYTVVESFEQLMTGNWPSLSRTWDPRVPLPKVTLAPLPDDIQAPALRGTEHTPPPPTRAPERTRPAPQPLQLEVAAEAPPAPKRRGRAAGPR
jgi:hypothetical protein